MFFVVKKNLQICMYKIKAYSRHNNGATLPPPSTLVDHVFPGWCGSSCWVLANVLVVCFRLALIGSECVRTLATRLVYQERQETTYQELCGGGGGEFLGSNIYHAEGTPTNKNPHGTPKRYFSAKI